MPKKFSELEPKANRKATAIPVTEETIYSLKRNNLSKLTNLLPAVDDLKAIEDTVAETVYWPIYTNVQANLRKVEDVGDEILKLFTRQYNNIQMRDGLRHTEYGDIAAEIMENTVQPGDDLCYKVAEFVRLFDEVANNPPVRIRSAFNVKEFQYIQAFSEVDHYMQVMDAISSVLTISIKNTIKSFVFSLLLSSTHKSYVKNYYMDRLWIDDLKLADETESKSYKEHYKKDGAVYKLCQKAAGEFKAKMKNHYVVSAYNRTPGDPERKGIYTVAAVPTQAASEDDVKTKFKNRFTVGGAGADKDKLPKFLSRDICILSMIEEIKNKVDDFISTPKYENWMGYDPTKKDAQETKKQLPTRCTKDNIVIFMNPRDLRACRRGAAYTSPHGTLPTVESLSGWDSDLGGIYGVDGFPPGEVLIIDKRAILIVPFFNRLFKNTNGWELIEQFFLHHHFKWAVFNYFCGCWLHWDKWIPDSSFITEFSPIYLAA